MALTPQVRDQLLDVVPFADWGDDAGAWQAARPLLAAWKSDADAAAGLALLIGHRRLSRTRRLQLAADLLLTHPTEVEVLYGLGTSADGLWGQRFLNASPPPEPVFHDIVDALQIALSRPMLNADRLRLAEVLASAAAVLGRTGDTVADRAYTRMFKVRRRRRWEDWYNYGLFLKSRGRWADSLDANRRAVAEGGGGDESVRWNLGIVATGAGRGEVALQVWRDLQQEVQLGEDGLPAGPYDPVQVRLAERPLAERTPDNDSPGHEEAVWVERVSPCHGIVRGEPVHSVGCHFGDVVLFDGTPLYHRPWNGAAVPVFGHLSTLRRGGYRIYAMGGVEVRRRQISKLAYADGMAVVPCVHREQVRQVCLGCLDPEQDHECVEAVVVEGVLCVSPDQELDGVDAALQQSLDQVEEPFVQLFVPDLHAELGNQEREEELRATLKRIMDGCPHDKD